MDSAFVGASLVAVAAVMLLAGNVDAAERRGTRVVAWSAGVILAVLVGGFLCLGGIPASSAACAGICAGIAGSRGVSRNDRALIGTRPTLAVVVAATTGAAIPPLMGIAVLAAGALAVGVIAELGAVCAARRHRGSAWPMFGIVAALTLAVVVEWVPDGRWRWLLLPAGMAALGMWLPRRIAVLQTLLAAPRPIRSAELTWRRLGGPAVERHGPGVIAVGCAAGGFLAVVLAVGEPPLPLGFC